MQIDLLSVDSMTGLSKIKVENKCSSRPPPSPAQNELSTGGESHKHFSTTSVTLTLP